MLNERNRHKARRDRRAKNNWCNGCDRATVKLGCKCPSCGRKNQKKMIKNLHIENFNDRQVDSKIEKNR